MVQLLLLGSMDVLVPRTKIGAGVNHSAIEPETVKLISHVVVMADIGGVSRFGVGDRQQGGDAGQSREGRISTELVGERNSRSQNKFDRSIDRDLTGNIGIGRATE